MSSLRNSLHRRNHKERSQLAHRERFGILEKHKDYVLRARDYHSKQDRITRLRQKAADRNKDEFYFGMVNQKTKRGVHIQERGNEALPVDIVKVLKSQDENYIRTTRSIGQKKIDKIKSQLTALADLVNPTDKEEELDEDELKVLREAGIISQPSSKRRRAPKAKHIVFAESEEQAMDLASSSQAQSESTGDFSMEVEVEQDDRGWKLETTSAKTLKKGKQRAQQKEVEAEKAEDARQEDAAANRTRLLKELSARLIRDKQLRYAERELQMQKLLMGKGASRKISGVERVDEDGNEDDSEDGDDRPKKKVDEKTWKPRVYKWKVERKR